MGIHLSYVFYVVVYLLLGTMDLTPLQLHNPFLFQAESPHFLHSSVWPLLYLELWSFSASLQIKFWGI